MSRRFEGRVAVVTGGSRGIGRAISEAFAGEGARVAINYVQNLKAAEETVKAIQDAGGEAFAVQANVSKKADVDRMIEEVVQRYGTVDILVCNAGVCPFIDFLDYPEEQYDWVMGINLKGLFLCGQAAGRVMREKGGGVIINVTSVSGLRVTDPRQSVYCSSKAGANMLTQTMAASLGSYNIRVNGVLPGTVPTDINVGQLAEPGVKDTICERTPLGRLGKTEEVAAAVLFLASDESAWTSGALLAVDGGFIV